MLKRIPPVDVLPSALLHQDHRSRSCGLEVQLEKPYYSPGEELKAIIRVDIKKQVIPLRVRWHLYGVELIHWEDEQGDVKKLFREERVILDSFSVLLDQFNLDESLRTTWEPSFTSEWSIRYPLPSTCIPSFSTESCWISYYLRAMIELDGFENIIQTIIPFNVVNVGNDKVEQIKTIQGEGVSESPTILRRLLGSSLPSQLKFTAELFPCVYNPSPETTMNTSISVNLKIDSQSSVPIKDIIFRLTQITKLQFKGDTFVEKENVVYYVHRIDPPIEANSSQRLNINIPVNSNVLYNPGPIKTNYITSKYILSVQIKQVSARCLIHVFTSEKGYKRELFIHPESQAELANDSNIWSVFQVGQWLEQEGLSLVKDIFIKEKIDGEALFYLTDSNLKDMGISAMGQRVKILHHINLLKENQNLPESSSWIDDRMEQKKRSLVSQ